MGNFYSFFLPFLFAFLLLLLHHSRSHESPYIYMCVIHSQLQNTFPFIILLHSQNNFMG